jgi:hypothetical protein
MSAVTSAPAGAPANPKLQRLLELESGVKERLDQAGVMLKEIRDRDLWKAAGHQTWEDYVRRRWGWSPEHARRQILAAEYRQVLPTPPRGGDKVDVQWPEKTVRELTRLGDKKTASRVAREAIDRAREQGAEVTAGFVRKLVDAELGVERGPLPKPEPPPEDERGDLPRLLEGVRYDMASARRKLREHVNADAWQHFGRTDGRYLVGEAAREARDLEAELRQALPLLNPRKRLSPTAGRDPAEPTAVESALAAYDRLTPEEQSEYLRRLNERRLNDPKE